MKILLLNGPNLNLLGRREKDIYGNTSFDDYFNALCARFRDITLHSYQSNVEGEIVNKIHEAGFTYDGMVLNAGAYTHTSIAIRDAIEAIKTPVVEVHISNVLTRESFRHLSVIGPACRGTIMGFGLDSYRLGIESFVGIL